MMQTEQELNAQVQSLVKKGSFDTAAEIIADWAYWDMIGRYEGELLTPLDIIEPDVGEIGPDSEQAYEDEPAYSMKGQLEDRLNEEFGEGGWKA